IKLTPIASTFTNACPGAAAGLSRSPYIRFSGPPVRSIYTAFMLFVIASVNELLQRRVIDTPMLLETTEAARAFEPRPLPLNRYGLSRPGPECASFRDRARNSRRSRGQQKSSPEAGPPAPISTLPESARPSRRCPRRHSGWRATPAAKLFGTPYRGMPWFGRLARDRRETRRARRDNR